VRDLLGHLEASEHAEPRIIWTGSLEGVSSKFDPADPQSVDSGHSYVSAKYQTSLVGWALNRRLSTEGYRSRSFSVHPGIVGSDMFSVLIGPLLYLAMFFCFYVVRV
jgi:3-keto steroid reductase